MTQSIGPIMASIENKTLSEEDKALLQNPLIAGLILFSRNYENLKQLKELTQSIRAINPNALIAVDQEGGRVQRFKEDFSDLPSAGSLKTPEEAQSTGHLMATEIGNAGIDFSIAPVLDLNLGRNSVIADRAFSDDPERVIKLASAFMDGMHDAGMAATGKHFPGHGHVQADSHLALPVSDLSLKAIEASDLKPFKALIEAGIEAIMPAHILFAQIDEKPACFSSFWLQTILRKQLGFQGAIISDDLSMQGAVAIGDIVTRSEEALKAGCDMILVCNDRPAVVRLLEELTDKREAVSSERLATMRYKGK